jgi:hypothetical protein
VIPIPVLGGVAVTDVIIVSRVEFPQEAVEASQFQVVAVVGAAGPGHPFPHGDVQQGCRVDVAGLVGHGDVEHQCLAFEPVPDFVETQDGWIPWMVASSQPDGGNDEQ